MRIPLTTVEALNITIASPCPASWDRMKGDEQVRHCDQCERHVYNLSEMSAAQAVALIQEKEGRLCVRLYRRADGSVMTADCPAGLRWRIWRWLRKRRAWAAALFAMLFLPGCPIGMGMPVVHTPNLPTFSKLPPDQAEQKPSVPVEQNNDVKRYPEAHE